MAKRYYTRKDIQKILENNLLQAEVFYRDGEKKKSPNNVIYYYRLTPNDSIKADDKLHIKKALLQISHYHKQKLDSIAELIANTFNVEPIEWQDKDQKSDYYNTVYRVEILTDGKW